MSGKAVPVRAIGTYYKNNSPAAGPNAGRMQGLVWHAKANRDPPLATVWLLEHPMHPSGHGVSIGNAAAAYVYAADVMQAGNATAMVQPPMPVALVPIPASNTTRATMNPGRWPARELALQLQARGMGTVRLALAQKQATDSQKGVRGKVNALVGNLEVVAAPPPDEFVVFVDDVLTYGDHIAAADIALGRSITGAVVIGGTHSVTRDAYDLLRPTVLYEWDEDVGWKVDVQY